MKKVKIKIPAKLNLTLDVTGKKDGYHVLDSLFVSVNVCDEIVVKERKDEGIRLSFLRKKTIPRNKKTCAYAEISPEKTNAYRAAEAYITTFGTSGADITVKRKIPTGGGLGGSSADAAGVLVALSKLYGYGKNDENGELTDIVNTLGSDGAFLLRGGLCRVRGRGTDVQPIPTDVKLYFLIVAGERNGDTAKCFKLYDERGTVYAPCTEDALGKLSGGDEKGFCSVIKNDLFEAANALNGEISRNLEALRRYGGAVMTGSGSAVFALFFDKKSRDKAFRGLKKRFGKRLLRAESLSGDIFRR